MPAAQNASIELGLASQGVDNFPKGDGLSRACQSIAAMNAFGRTQELVSAKLSQYLPQKGGRNPFAAGNFLDAAKPILRMARQVNQGSNAIACGLWKDHSDLPHQRTLLSVMFTSPQPLDNNQISSVL